MDRYIECKTQEQWNIVVEHLNKKYRCTAESRRDYLNDWVTHEENTVLYDTGNYLWEYCSRDWYNRDRAAISFTTFEEFCKQEGINIDKTMTTQEEINELKTRLQELEEKYKKENEFKVGDIVAVTLQDISTNYAQEGHVGKLLDIIDTGFIIEHSEMLEYEGSFCRKVRKATQAEIDQYLAKNKPIEISGYKAEFNKANKTVSFGCKKDITKKDLEAILTVMKLNEKFDFSFIIGDTAITCEDNDIDVSKETTQKLIDKLKE